MSFSLELNCRWNVPNLGSDPPYHKFVVKQILIFSDKILRKVQLFCVDDR
jgi:hypothetical protein